MNDEELKMIGKFKHPEPMKIDLTCYARLILESYNQSL